MASLAWGFEHVGDDDVAGVLTVDGHMDDGARRYGRACHATPSRSISLLLPTATSRAVHLGDDAVCR